MLSSTLSTILASAIGIRTSSSTLLRAVDRSYCLARVPRVLGIDDFAIRRDRTYGTLLCNLETGRPVDILAGPTAEPVAQWISQHPSVEIVARDRATAYAQAVSSAAPDAIQVAEEPRGCVVLRCASTFSILRFPDGCRDLRCPERLRRS
jgi:transposase